ncbi:MAG: hypothetical protein V4696_02200 [Pseudomonadota bacterium]
MTDEQAMSGKAIYDMFFQHGEVRPLFRKEYISLWSGWLGKERLYLLDQVSEEEWSRFNRLLLAAFGAFRTGVVNHAEEAVEFATRLEPLLSDYQDSMRKDASQFSQFVMPALDCVITEEWDYTYILWHRNTEALEAIKPLLSEAKLLHFSD